MATVYRLYPLPFMDGHPLEESEWNNVLGLLEQVNRPKAKVLSAIYREHVTTSWRNYLRVYEEAYARIEELNRRLDDQREKYEQDLRMYLSKLEEREAFWEERIKEPRDEYMRLSVSAEGIQNAWPERLTRSVHGPREYWEVIQSMSHREDDNESRTDAPQSSADGDVQPQPDQTVLPTSESSDGSMDLTITPVRATHEEALEPLTIEEVADETQLPTFAEPPTPVWVRVGFTATLGLLAGYLLCVATGLAQPTAQAITLAAIGASVVLYGIWETTRSAAAIASEAFHLQWVGTFAKKLRAMVWFFAVVVLATGVMQAVWHAFISGNTPPGGAFAQGPAATAGYLLWLTWPWFLLIAALDGFLRGRGEAVGNRIRAEVVRAKRAEAAIRAAAPSLGEDGESGHPASAWRAHSAGGASPSQTPTSGITPSVSEPPTNHRPGEGEEGSDSSAALLMRYRAKRAEYEALRRQRDLELAFIGRRIKDMQSFLSPTRYVPSQSEQVRIEMARSDYEKVCTWFLKQLADALRDVGGGVNAGEIIQRFAEQFGMAIPGAAEGNKDNRPARGFA